MSINPEIFVLQTSDCAHMCLFYDETGIFCLVSFHNGSRWFFMICFVYFASFWGVIPYFLFFVMNVHHFAAFWFIMSHFGF